MRLTPAAIAEEITLRVPFTAGSISSACASLKPPIKKGLAVWKTMSAPSMADSNEPSESRSASCSVRRSEGHSPYKCSTLALSPSDRTVPRTMKPRSHNCLTSIDAMKPDAPVTTQIAPAPDGFS